MTQNHSTVFNLDFVIGMIKTIMNHCYSVLNVDLSKNCGCFTVLDKSGNLILKFHIGELPAEKFERYYTFSEEKARRLHKNLEIGHVSSFQSRNPEKDQWGGAISAGDYILSFSGMPEIVDEIMMLLLAIELGLLKYEDALMIVAAEGRESYDKVIASLLTSLKPWQ